MLTSREKLMLILAFVIVLLSIAFESFGSEVLFTWTPPSMEVPANQKITKYRLYKTTAGVEEKLAEIEGRDTTSFTLITDDIDKQCYILRSVAVYGEGAEVIEKESDRSNEPCDILAPAPDPPKDFSIWKIIVAFFKRIFSWLA